MLLVGLVQSHKSKVTSKLEWQHNAKMKQVLQKCKMYTWWEWLIAHPNTACHWSKLHHNQNITSENVHDGWALNGTWSREWLVDVTFKPSNHDATSTI